MIILFEGFENTGKTEISTELSRLLEIPRYKDTREHKCFSGKSSYSQELSLVHETYKILSYFDQGIIKNVILDRDYISEYAYGKIYRPKQYDKYDCENYIWAYDNWYFLNNLYTIFCYKNKYNGYSDPLVQLSDKDKVDKRYLEFFNKTVNKTLMLNTESEDLVDQTFKISKWLAKHEQIERFNEKTYFEKSINNNKIYFPGKFNGDKILFVGQNPGQPLAGDELSKKIHTIKYDNFKAFMLDHNKSYNNSKYYKFLLDFVQKRNLFPSDFSFTNIVKYSTADNRPLTKSEINDGLDILRTQIEIFDPAVIISFGISAHNSLIDLGIDHLPYYHPARYFYKKTEKIKR